MESDHSHIKFFLGILFNGEVKMHLNQSQSWKEATLFKNQVLIETFFQDKQYIGILLDSPFNYSDIKNKEQELKKQLQLYSSKLILDKQKVYLFPQLFLS